MGNKLNIYLNHLPPENGVLTYMALDEKNEIITSILSLKNKQGNKVT